MPDLPKSSVSPATDPLKPFAGKPVYSGGDPDGKYLGRLIIEAWRPAGAADAVTGLNLTLDPATSTESTELIERIATALQRGVAAVRRHQGR